jgi:putative (di)nucleoside polyphosphate hydrolase
MRLPSRYFRAGVGAVIANNAGRILALERSAIPGAWQLPQGGLEAGEEPIDAVLREIKEETGLAKKQLQLVDRYPEPLVYELPREHQKHKTGMGQVQYWFLFKLKKPIKDLRLPKRGEFRAWAWLPFERVVNDTVSFRKPVYRRLQDYFERHL